MFKLILAFGCYHWVTHPHKHLFLLSTSKSILLALPTIITYWTICIYLSSLWCLWWFCLLDIEESSPLWSNRLSSLWISPASGLDSSSELQQKTTTMRYSKTLRTQLWSVKFLHIYKFVHSLELISSVIQTSLTTQKMPEASPGGVWESFGT